MELVLTPPTNGDDWTVPEYESKHVPNVEPIPDETVDELAPEPATDPDADETEPTDDPDH